MSVQISNAQQRVLKVMLSLSGYEYKGLRTKDVAKINNISIVNASRDLGNLKEAGLVEKMETNYWRLTNIIPKMGLLMLSKMEEQQSKFENFKNNYTN